MAKVTLENGLTDTFWNLCRPHRAGHRGCKAVAVQRALQRRGYWAGQYQGTVKTDAPSVVAREAIAKYGKGYGPTSSSEEATT
jgi:hypothetical protein